MKTLLLVSTLLFSSMLLADDLKLAWDNNPIEQEVLRYFVYDLGTGEPVPQGSSTSNRITIDVIPGPHHFVVTASNYWGESEYSEPVFMPQDATAPRNLHREINITVNVNIE